MKKRIIFILTNLLMLTEVFAYKLETIREIPFDDFFQYYETWLDDVGYSDPGIAWIIYDNGNFLGFNECNGKAFYVSDKITKYDEQLGYVHTKLGSNYLIATRDGRRYYKNRIDFDNPDYVLKMPDETFEQHNFGYNVYQTGNRVYAQVGKGAMVSWELKGEGKSEYRNAGETEEELSGGLREELGIEYDDDGSEIYFGETTISRNSYPNSRKIWKRQTFRTPGYEENKNLEGFTYLGTTKNGTALHFRLKRKAGEKSPTKNPDKPITVVIAVLDPWTREVNVIELEPGCWNPPRDEKRGIIPAVSRCIDEEGNVYFTDCNKEKGCYEIKKLSNEWLNQYEFANRPIARMKANHIALQEYPGEEEGGFNGYNYEHEYLWILSKTGDWLKVRKVDGREGWVNMQYVSINEGTDLSSLELTKKELKELNAQKKKELNQKK